MSPELVVLVDARNVQRSVWPNVSDGELVQLIEKWTACTGHRVVAVFDGRTQTGGYRSPVEVVETGGGTADDWLAGETESLRGQGRRFWLVTSDRALRTEAGRGAERVIGGGTFVRELLALRNSGSS